MLINNVGIQQLVITFTVLSFDMGILEKKKKKHKTERETHINWHDLHHVEIMRFQHERSREFGLVRNLVELWLIKADND